MVKESQTPAIEMWDAKTPLKPGIYFSNNKLFQVREIDVAALLSIDKPAETSKPAAPVPEPAIKPRPEPTPKPKPATAPTKPEPQNFARQGRESVLTSSELQTLIAAPSQEFIGENWLDYFDEIDILIFYRIYVPEQGEPREYHCTISKDNQRMDVCFGTYLTFNPYDLKNGEIIRVTGGKIQRQKNFAKVFVTKAERYDEDGNIIE